MTKETKKNTTRKATVAKKVVTNKTNRKEEKTMTVKPTKEEILDAVKTLRIDVVNAHIKRINDKIAEDKHPQYYNYYRTEEEIIKLIQNDRQYKEYIKALITVEKLHRTLINHAKEESKRNRAYGIELAHPSELQKLEPGDPGYLKKEHEDRLQSEFDTMKKEIAKLNKVITKALKEKEQA